MKTSTAIVSLARRFALAGDATRLAIMCAMMRRKGACVSELAAASKESVAVVSHHLRALAAGGIVKAVRSGKRVCYMLSDDPFATDLKRMTCKYARSATR